MVNLHLKNKINQASLDRQNIFKEIVFLYIL